jgi:AbrB family looped-hinge helix DNA binding protein
MKVGYIARPNKKGQVVIPKKLRDELGITSDTAINFVIRDNGVYMYPIEEVVVSSVEKGKLDVGKEKKRKSSQKKKDPLLELIGIGKSRTGRVGLNVDEIYERV